MKTKLLLMTILFTLCGNLLAAPAFWTGQMRLVTTVTHQQAVSCEYRYSTQTFWKTFVGGYCPAIIESQ